MKKQGLYGYYDKEKEYVVYIGKDVDIGNNKRCNDHKQPSQYDKQVINKVVQNNPDRYVYFKFVEGEYNDETLNELEKEAIRLFKTYKYDYPERSVFNFQRGGEGGSERGQNSTNWRQDDYKVVKYGMDKKNKRYCILGRCGNVIKTSIDKKKLEELTNKLNNHEITKEEVKNLQLYDAKERAKNIIQAPIKYNIWDVSYCHYNKKNMLIRNGGDKPRRCFIYKYKGRTMPIGMFNEFISPEIIGSIVQEEVKNEK